MRKYGILKLILVKFAKGNKMMNQKNFVIKGNIIYSKSKTELEMKEHAYSVCEDGKCAGVHYRNSIMDSHVKITATA